MQILPVDLAGFLSKYLYLVLTFVLFQGSLTFILVFLFIEKLINTRKRKADELLAKQDAYEESLRILNESKSQSAQIMLAAQEKSTKIIQETTYLNDNFKNIFETELKQLMERQEVVFSKVAEDLSQQYKQAFEQEKITTLTELTKTSELLRTDMLTKVDEFKDVLQKNTIEAESELKQQAQKDYEELSHSMKEYEDIKLKQIDEKIFYLLTYVTKAVIGKAMTVSDHEELVLKILNEAKIKQRI